MKCARCNKEVPVLTPSPAGEQDLCEECYAQVYEELQARRAGGKKGLFGAILFAAILVGVFGYILLRPGRLPDNDTKQKRLDLKSLTGPNKAAALLRRKPKPPLRSSRKPALPAAAAPSPGKRKIERSGTAALRTPSAVLRFASARKLRTVSIVPVELPEGTSAPVITDEEFQLIEVTLNAAPTAQGVGEVEIPAVLLSAGGEIFSPFQTRVFSHPYRAPSAEVLELAEGARIVVVFEAQEDGVEPVSRGRVIEEVVVGSTGRTERIPVTFLYAIPPGASPPYKIVMDDQELTVPEVKPPPEKPAPKRPPPGTPEKEQPEESASPEETPGGQPF